MVMKMTFIAYFNTIKLIQVMMIYIVRPIVNSSCIRDNWKKLDTCIRPGTNTTQHKNWNFTFILTVIYFTAAEIY